VPEAFRRQPQLILQYGLDMPVPIPDLDVTDEGVTATLSFSRSPHKTHVPWSAVFLVGLTDGQELLKAETYQEDVPPGVSINIARVTEGEGEGDSRPTPARHLQSVPADGDLAAADDDEASPRRRRKPQLRLVK
jgi:hypothetical protein